MAHPLIELIDGLEFFRSFSYPQLETIAGYLSLVEAAGGDAIFREGDPGTCMLILVSGRIAVYKTGENGRHLLSFEQPGRIIGEMALLDHERRSATCIAEQDCVLVTLGQDSLERLADEHAALAYQLMHAIARLLSRRLRRTSGVLAEHLVD